MNLAFRRRESASPRAPTAAAYAQAVEVVGATNLLFISGQIPMTVEGSVPEAFEDQARLVWRNVTAQLEAAGMGLDNLVKVTVFLADRAHIDAYRRTRDEALGGRKVALTTIITGIFDEGWMLEIEAIAAA
jgi:2-iminobutanoate/2-iminopropanoate deaminase